MQRQVRPASGVFFAVVAWVHAAASAPDPAPAAPPPAASFPTATAATAAAPPPPAAPPPAAPPPVAPPAPATPAPPAACIPACRAGFVCVSGACVSACNPPCPAGQECTAAGACAYPPPPAAAVTPVDAAAPGATTPGPKDHARESWALGLRVGPVFPGTIWVDEEVEVETAFGVMVGAGIDAIAAKRFSFGAYGSIVHLPPEYGSDAALVKALGVALKGRFGSGFQVRPGISIGYQSTGGDFDEVHGLGIGAEVEAASAIGDSSVFPTFAVGIISQPVGGNDSFDLTFAPIFYLAGGVEFGQ